MAEESDKPKVGTKPTLDDLFKKAGLGPHLEYEEGAIALRSLKRELQCLRFAQMYVKNRFDATKAYAAFNPKARKHQLAARAMKWMMSTRTGARVAHHVRQIIQEATSEARDAALLDVQELLQINQMLITADAMELVEQATDGATGRVYSRFKPAARMGHQQRMSVHTIRIRDGEVTQLQTYNRLEAERLQVALLELLSEKGGNDQNWMGKFHNRINEARRRRLEMEVEAAARSGKVLRLPSASANFL